MSDIADHLAHGRQAVPLDQEVILLPVPLHLFPDPLLQVPVQGLKLPLLLLELPLGLQGICRVIPFGLVELPVEPELGLPPEK